MKQLARIISEEHGDIVVARIEGEIDMSNAPALGNRIRELLTNRSEALIVDLADTTYLDSSGIALLFGLGDELRRRQQEMHVVIPETSQLLRAIKITGFDRAVPTHATLQEALDRSR